MLGSYVVGLAGSPEGAGAVWGGVPDGLRPLYTVNMLLAAAGFFPFTGLVFFGLDPERARVAGRPALPILIGVYAVILVASALWMPLTFRMLAEPGPALWAAIRGVLAVTGLASLALYPLLAAVEPRPRGWPWRLAQLGLFFFCFQTALLDAIVWPAYWPH